MTNRVRWRADGWRGWIDPGTALEPAALVAASGTDAARASRHARTVSVVLAGGRVFVKRYPPPGSWRARRAFRMGHALDAAGFATPRVLLLASRGGEGLLVTRDAGGEGLDEAVVRLGREGADSRRAKRRLLRALGAEVGRLHREGFVHGDLVPPNVRVRGGEFVFLDNDRTRRGRLLVLWGARRNLVQLGRFVVPGLTLADRARVLVAYAAARGWSRRARRRVARWVVAKTTARRCAIDHIPPPLAQRAGFRELMRSGGPFDPAGRAA